MGESLYVEIVTANRMFDQIAGNILGIIEYGEKSEFAKEANTKFLPYQFIQVENVSGNFCEVWYTTESVYYKKVEGCSVGESDHFCFRTVTVNDEMGTHQQNAKNAYNQIFLELNLDVYHVVRFWNYIPEINEKGEAQERYKEFCAGREEAFSEFYQKNGKVYPAATGIGTNGSNLCISLLAIHKSANRYNIENPRQVPAYQYPEQYGTSSPKFSRATYVELENEKILLVSGTASIIGTTSVYIGDAFMQTKTTIDNIKILLSEKNLREYFIECSEVRAQLQYLKVYIKNWGDFPIIKQICERSFGNQNIVYLQNDICRKELLVEMEGVWMGNPT
ncbi:hypothetical protein ABFV83_17240 [Lacrimispora sp. BS-2]|uniref:Chorismatase FkbO/Hyg5-like N-terminal domain-containing protein n=1 Tax=Lacrimispora sp. BS-2 TaxID=3151850 RepID=A0AAU7PMR8_9FIRM